MIPEKTYVIVSDEEYNEFFMEQNIIKEGDYGNEIPIIYINKEIYISLNLDDNETWVNDGHPEIYELCNHATNDNDVIDIWMEIAYTNKYLFFVNNDMYRFQFIINRFKNNIHKINFKGYMFEDGYFNGFEGLIYKYTEPVLIENQTSLKK